MTFQTTQSTSSNTTVCYCCIQYAILNKALPIPLGHGEFFIEFLYSLLKKNVNIKEIPFEQKLESDSISKTAPNIKTFFFMGIKYLFRIIITKIRN